MRDSLKNNSYDEMPYESYPYPLASPLNLATLATFFGMRPPPIEDARVLELGCAAGGNLIPHAIHYPQGRYLGIDLSAKQIARGQSDINALGITNIELRHCSIIDVDKSFGEFDYIICHGVFSWVPENIQEKILEISNKNLARNGVVYISYNTLPGWNISKTIRDMMLYHTKGFSNSQDKVRQARELLSFVQDSLAKTDTPYSKILLQEAKILAERSDHYLRHDHLEENNYQFYFSEFLDKARKHNLQYLSDVSLSTMYLDSMQASVEKNLNTENDIVGTAQYLDFINNRKFRSTLLCHRDVSLNRNLNTDQIRQFALSLDIVPEKAFEYVDLISEKAIDFYFLQSNNQSVSISSPYLKAVFYVLSAHRGYPIKFDRIVALANKIFPTDEKTTIEAELLDNAMSLIMKGFMEINVYERDKNKIHLTKPVVDQLIFHQVHNTNKDWITSPNHQAIFINSFRKSALKYMNGQNTKEQILENLLRDAVAGNLDYIKNNEKIEDIEQIKQELALKLDKTIESLYSKGVFK
ncbi:MAG: methyltransferase regulatory domain-containing protein [Rickettsiaceae bacterium]